MVIKRQQKYITLNILPDNENVTQYPQSKIYPIFCLAHLFLLFSRLFSRLPFLYWSDRIPNQEVLVDVET